MMPGLAEIYDEAFFREWGPRNEAYVASARQVGAAILEVLAPRSLADLGCGCGVYSHFFRGEGVEVLSLDGVLPPAEDRFPVEIELADLTAPLENRWGRFDLALCLEVAEHIPEPLSAAFLENLTRFSDTLALSCAPPGQGGRHHVNERPKRYWVRRLAEMGWVYDRPRTGRLMEIFQKGWPPYRWMGSQISIYVRDPERAASVHLPLIGRVRAPGNGGAR